MPPVAVLDALTGENVTQAVLDPARDYFIVVYAGLGFEFLKRVVENPPSAAELFQSTPGAWRPTLRDAVESTANSVVYSMPAGSITSGPGECSFVLAAGLLRRSDSTYSRPRQFSISFGFLPTVSFTDGVSTDLEHGNVGPPAWLGNGVNGTLRMIITAPPAVKIADANATDWVRYGAFYSGDGLPAPERLPGGLRVLSYSYSALPLGNSLEIVLNVSGVPPGQYPITVREASLWDLSPSPYSLLGAPTKYKSLSVTGWLKVGLRPSWHVFDADTGADITGQPVEGGANVQVAFVLDGEGESDAIQALGVAAAAGALSAVPSWGTLVNADTISAVPLPSGTPPVVVRTPFSFALAYPLRAGSPLSPGLKTLSSTPTSGAVCNGAPGRALMCSAVEQQPGALIVGVRPTAGVFDGATQTNSYGGALDAAGAAPLSLADTPQPCFAPSIAIVFTDEGSGGTVIDDAWAAGGYVFPAPWGVAIVASPPLPVPTVTPAYTGSGMFTLTWSANTIASGVYDVTLLPGALFTGDGGGGATNVRVTVRMIVGPQLVFMGANTTILRSGADAAGSAPLPRRGGANGPFVTSATAALLRLSGPAEAAFTLSEVVASVVDANTSAPLLLQTLGALDAMAVSTSTAVPGAALRSDYALSLSGLVDGTYVLTLRTGAAGAAGGPLGPSADGSLVRTVAWTDAYGEALGARTVSVTLVVARAPWVGNSVTLAAPVGIGGLSGEIPLPAGLFSGSPLLWQGGATVTLVTTPSTDARGLVLGVAGGGRRGGAVALPAAVLLSDPGTVVGPPGPRELLLRATSEVGAVAEARLTVNFVLRPRARLLAVDPRGVANDTVLMVKPSETTPAGVRVALSLDAVFEAPGVVGGAAGDVTCALVTGGVAPRPCSGLVPTLSVVAERSGGVMRYRWSFTVNETDANRVVDTPGAFIVLSLRMGNSIVGAGSGLPMLPAGEVRALVDAHAPMYAEELQLDDPENPFLVGFYTYPGKYIPRVLPIVGVLYYTTLPMYMMDDQFSPAKRGGVRIVGPDPAWDEPHGLKLTGGPLGRAFVSGIATSSLTWPEQSVFFNVIAEDLAGNRRTYRQNIQVPILPRPPRPAPTIALSVSSALTFTEGDEPLYVDPHLAFSLPPGASYSDVIDGARLILEGGEANATFHEAQLEMLDTLNPCPERCTLRTFHNDVGTGFGTIELYPTAVVSDGLFGRDVLAGNMTLLDAKDFFRMVRYSNTRVRISSLEPRTVRMQVLLKYLGDGVSESAKPVIVPLRGPLDPPTAYFVFGLLAGASRIINVVSVNNPPVVTLPSPPPAAVWVQAFAGAGGTVVAPLAAALAGVPADLWLTDADDTALLSVSVAIDPAAGVGDGGAWAWGGCDPARDVLALPPDYRPIAELYGEWSAPTCTLKLTPAPPLSAISFSQAREALVAVQFSSLTPTAPTGWGGANATRRVLLSVLDAGASSTAPLAVSAPVSVPLRITVTEQPYVLNARAALTGVLSSVDPYAALKAFPTRDAVVYQRKWPLVLPGLTASNGATVGTPTLASPTTNCTVWSATAVRCVLALELGAVPGVNGSWAGGAVTHPYALEGPVVPPSLSFLSGGTLVGGQLVGATEVALGDTGSGAGAAALRSAFLPSAGDAATGFAYARKGPSTLTLLLARAPPDATLGEFTLQLNVAPAAPYAAPVTIQFGVDLMRAGCVLGDSPDYAGGARIGQGLVYPDNSLCRFPPLDVAPAVGGTFTRGTFSEDVASLEARAAAAATDGASEAAVVAMLTAARVKARGGASFYIPPGALGAAASLTLVVAPAAVLALLPPPPAVATDGAAPRIDTGVALMFGPAGTTFDAPFTVCILVGDVPADQMVVLVMTSLVDAAAPGRGYGAWEFMRGGSFSAASGKVCGKGTHFSIVAPMMSGFPRLETVPKRRLPSGGCPAPLPLEPGAAPGPQCGGNGVCEAGGRCVCFAGFTGLACSQRTCPAAESWGQTLFFGGPAAAALGAPGSDVHGVEECAGRGACDRASGTCTCSPGFEGAACERMACPHRVVKTTSFLFQDNSDKEKAAEEAAWEAAFLQDLETEQDVREVPVRGSDVQELEACSGNGRCLPVDGDGGWGGGRVQRCVCDAGWTGGDCSLRTCPVGVDLAWRDTYAKWRAEYAAACSGGASCPSPPAPHVQRLTLAFPGFPETASLLPVEAGSDEVVLVASEPLRGARQAASAVAGVWAGTADAADALAAALAALPGFRLAGDGITVTPRNAAPSTPATLSVAYDFSFSPDAFAAFGGDPPALSCADALSYRGLMGGCTAPACRPRHRQLRATKVAPALPTSFTVDPVAVLRQPDAVPGSGSTPPRAGWAVQTTLRLVRVAPGQVAFQWAETTVFGVAAPEEDTELTPLPPAALRRPMPGPLGLLLQVAEDDDAQVMDDLHAAGAGGVLGPWALHFAWRLPTCSVAIVQTTAPPTAPAECSDRGVCDREAGACKCFKGWRGQNCNTADQTW